MPALGAYADQAGLLWERLRSDRFYRDSIWLTLALLTVNVSSYLLTVVLSRFLPKTQFGEVVTLLSLVFLFNVPALAFQNLLTREVAQRPAGKSVGEVFGEAPRLAYISAAIVAVGGIALSPWLRSFLHLESIWPAILVALVAALSLIVPLYRGVLQGLRRFEQLTFNIGTEAALRLLGSVVLVIVGLQTSGVLAAFGLAMITVFVLGKFATSKDLAVTAAPRGGTASINLLDVAPMMAAMAGIYGLFNLDLVLAKHFMSARLAGEYAVLSLAGRAVLYLTSSIGGVLLSAGEDRRSPINKLLLVKGLTAVLGAAVAIELLYTAATKPLVMLVFGATYSEVAPWLPVVGAGMVALAGTNLLMYFLIAMRRVGFVTVLALSLCLEAGMIVWRHQGPGDVAIAFSVAAVVSFLGLGAFALLVLRESAMRTAQLDA